MNWREQITRPTLCLNVGGFRPSSDLFANYFGEVKVGLASEVWPHCDGAPMLPLCQLNLSMASFRPENLNDIELVCVFISENFMTNDKLIVSDDINFNEASPAWAIRIYKSLSGLCEIAQPDINSHMKKFECIWDEKILDDYPSHEMLPIDFDQLKIGDYYDQDNIDTIHRTKLGGWPSIIQSEPMWGNADGSNEFEFVFQIESEPKAHWTWGDGGTGHIARSKLDPHKWALDFQFL